MNPSDRDFFFRFCLPFNFDALFFGQSLFFEPDSESLISFVSFREREIPTKQERIREKKNSAEKKKGIEIKWEDPDQNQEKEGNLKKKRNLKRIKSELNLYIFNLIFKLISIFQDSSKKSHNLIELKTFVPIFGR